MHLQVDVDATQLRAELSSIPPRARKALVDATYESVPIIERDAARHIRDITKKGVYWDIDSEVNPNSSGATAHVRTPSSKPHRIEPKDKKALAFHWPNAPAGVHRGKDGRVVLKGVDHPGSKPVNWLAPFAAEPHLDISGIYDEHVSSELGLGGPNLSSPAGGFL